MIKRKKSFTRVLRHSLNKKGAVSAPTSHEPVSSTPIQSPSTSAPSSHQHSSIRASIQLTAKAPKRRYSAADYKAELKSAIQENKRLRSDVESLQKKLTTAEIKHKRAVDAHQRSLHCARASKKMAMSTEETVQSQDRQLRLQEEQTHSIVLKAVAESEEKAKVSSDH